jgi:hypothetical protein
MGFVCLKECVAILSGRLGQVPRACSLYRLSRYRMPHRKNEPPVVLEQLRLGTRRFDESLVAQILAECSRGCGHERNQSGLTPLPGQTHLRWRSKPQVAYAQVDDLLSPGAGIIDHAQEFSAAPPHPSRAVGLGEQYRQGPKGEIGGLSVTNPLQWDRDDALALGQVLGCLRLHVPKEGTQRGEPVIASLRTPLVFVHDVVDEGKQARCVNVFEGQPLHGNIAAFLAVVGITLLPVQRNDNLWPAPYGVRNPLGKRCPKVDALIARHPVDLLDDVLRDLILRFGQTLPFRVQPYRTTARRWHWPETAHALPAAHRKTTCPRNPKPVAARLPVASHRYSPVSLNGAKYDLSPSMNQQIIAR